MKLEDLPDEDRAFAALLEGFYVQVAAMKLAFPAGRHTTALDVLQAVLVRLAVAASTPSEAQKDR